MKKTILTLSAFLMSFTFFANEKPAMDQDTSSDYFYYQPKKVRYGFFLAPSVDWMTSKNESASKSDFTTMSLDNFLGFKMGITVDYGVANGIGFSSGIHYNNTQGQLFTRRVSGSDLQSSIVNVADITYKVGFIEVPLDVRYTTPDLFEHFRIYGTLGLGASFRIHKQAAMTLNYNDSNGVEDDYQQDFEPLKGWLSVAPVSMHWNAGIGAQYDVDYKRTVYLGVFYQNNFLPDMTNPNRINFPVGDLTMNDGSVRWNHIALRLGVMF